MNDENTSTDKKVYEAGTWQATLDKSATLFERSGKARKQASSLLWAGAQEGIESWLDSSDTDVQAEVLYADVLDIMGTGRKGDVSKIRTVALAVKNNGLVLASYPNLSKAYAEATRLTKTVKVHAAEDTAADEAVSAIAPPKSASTAENAALIVMSAGVDEAARLLLDALNVEGVDNPAAHRAFLRAIGQEIAGRVPKPAPKPAKKAAAKKTTAKKATVKAGASKAKPATKGAAKKATAKPASKKAASVEEPEVEDIETDEVEEPTIGDMFDDIEGDNDEGDEEEAEVEEAPAAKPKPVRRGPVRRS